MSYADAFRKAMIEVGAQEYFRGQGTVAASINGWLDVLIHPAGGGMAPADVIDCCDRAQVLLDAVRAEAESKREHQVWTRTPNRRARR